jgi:RNA polymerase sigma-70 factor, ECF subfamily
VPDREDEFERAVMRYSRDLLRTARRLVGDSVSAEDLVQETLLAAWSGFSTFQSGSNLRAWLFRILMNRFYSRGRKSRTLPIIVPLTDIDSTPTSASGREFAKLDRAFDELGAEHREVLLLGVVEEFTCREMAEILNVPIGTVMSRLSRARSALRSRLGVQPGKKVYR